MNAFPAFLTLLLLCLVCEACVSVYAQDLERTVSDSGVIRLNSSCTVTSFAENDDERDSTGSSGSQGPKLDIISLKEPEGDEEEKIASIKEVQPRLSTSSSSTERPVIKVGSKKKTLWGKLKRRVSKIMFKSPPLDAFARLEDNVSSSSGEEQQPLIEVDFNGDDDDDQVRLLDETESQAAEPIVSNSRFFFSGKRISFLGCCKSPEKKPFSFLTSSSSSTTTSPINVDLLKIVRMQMDGNCQFRALSQLLFGHQKNHSLVRRFIAHHLSDPESDYLSPPLDVIQMMLAEHGVAIKSKADLKHYYGRNGVWGDDLTLSVAVNLFNMELAIVPTSFAVVKFRPSSDSSVIVLKPSVQPKEELLENVFLSGTRFNETKMGFLLYSGMHYDVLGWDDGKSLVFNLTQGYEKMSFANETFHLKAQEV